VLYAVAACLVAVGALLWRLHWIVLDLLGVMMCLLAQRRGQEVEMNSQQGKHSFHFRTKRKR
jgi:hypothetical protein